MYSNHKWASDNPELNPFRNEEDKSKINKSVTKRKKHRKFINYVNDSDFWEANDFGSK